MKAKYIRVSTTEQNISRQEEAGFILYVDKISGSVPFNERPEAIKLLKAIEAGKVDEVHVQSIDRLGRNTLDILQTIKQLSELQVNLIAQKEGLQTLVEGKENPTAKLVINIMASLAEFELQTIKERQREGIQRAKARGAYSQHGGSESKTMEELLAKPKNATALKELQRGESIRRTAKLAGISPSQVQRVRDYARQLGRL